MKNEDKKQPYGYIAPRPNFLSLEEQINELVEYGVDPANILNHEDGIDRAVGWCGSDTDLVVASATVFGTVTEYDRVLEGMAKSKAVLVLIRADNLRVDAKGTEAYRKGKKDLNLRNVLIGKTHGRKKTIDRATAEKIYNYAKVQGNSGVKTAEKFKTSTARVSDIVNMNYYTTFEEPKKNRGKASK